MITFHRVRPSDGPAPAWVEARRREGTTAVEMPAPEPGDITSALEGGLLPVAANGDAEGVVSWIVDPAAAHALHDRGVAGWRLTVADSGEPEAVLDALARTGAAFLRTGRSTVAGAARLCSLPAITARPSVFVDSIEDAVAAAADGAGDLLLRGWDTESIGELRDSLEAPLVERTALPPSVSVDAVRTELSRDLLKVYLDQVDGSGAARPRNGWSPGADVRAPMPSYRISAEWADERWTSEPAPSGSHGMRPALQRILERSLDGFPPSRSEIELLFSARGDEVDAIARAADELRRRAVGDEVSYVINRNINYTNQCYFRCGFCAFSKGPRSLNLRGDPYLLEVHEVAFRAREAAEAGATEVCLQGGIHPEFTGDFYISVVEAVKEAVPEMHIHGFTPLEVWQGAETLGVPVESFLERLFEAGLGTLPGTAAEILDDSVRKHLCPDKVTTAEWAHVMVLAHEIGLRSTATIMFGHIDGPRSWANHFEVLRDVQRRTGGFTEFVPLPFVHMGAPIYLRGRARPGPTWDEVVLMHAVARIAFDGLIPNIQASWVKLGLDGGAALLRAGCNDMGGTLMDENISRAAGASHGRLVSSEGMEAAIQAAGRRPVRRSTLYEVLERS